MAKHKSIIAGINYGYDAVEPIIIGLMAQNRSFLLVGRHGTGKSRLVRYLANGYGGDGFVFYDATKDDLVSVAGIPDAHAMQSGELRFVQHQRAIWNKTAIMVDELTRAGKESQNMWLEILEEQTCFGLPLVYQCLVATANPESYAAANRLDQALLDRFYAVVNVPENQGGLSSEEVGRMFDLNFADGMGMDQETTAEELANTFGHLRLEYEKLLQDPRILARVRAYTSAFSSFLLNSERQKDDPVYISPRTYARNFPEVLLAMAAFFRYAGHEDVLEEAARYAYRYALGTKIGLDVPTLEEIHESFKSYLLDDEQDEVAAVRVEMASLSDLDAKVEYCRKHALRLAELLQPDEVEKFVSSIFKEIDRTKDTDKLIDLSRAVDAIRKGHEELNRRIDGKLILSLNAAISRVSPLLHHMLNTLPEETRENRRTKDKIRAFLQLCGRIERLAATGGTVEDVKRYLLNVHDGDEELNERRIIEVFASVDAVDLQSEHG